MLEAQMVWGWQPALYLFLGGLGAGAFITAAILFFRTGEDHRKALSITSWIAAGCLVVGLLLLLLELTQPLRGLLLWQSFSNFGSWMTIGAWVVLAATLVFGITAMLMTERIFDLACKLIRPLPKIRSRVCQVLFGLGAVLGFSVAAYTGLLLMAAPGIPFWNSWLLPCLFVVSALDTGIAVVEIIIATVERDDSAHKVRRSLEIAVILLVVIEAVVLFAYLESMFSGGNIGSAVNTYSGELAAYASADALTNGTFAPYFWGLLVACGLGIPLVAAATGLFVKGKLGKVTVFLGACCALIGGCTLRFLILCVGIHADFIADAVYWLTP
jgi:formate-dependent nitrite reductase membrane component NrfD